MTQGKDVMVMRIATKRIAKLASSNLGYRVLTAIAVSGLILTVLVGCHDKSATVESKQLTSERQAKIQGHKDQ